MSSPVDEIKSAAENVGKRELLALSDICLAAGFLSIVASILTWFTAKDEDRAHAERFGIFVGLWVPSFFILSNRLARKAEEAKN